MARLARLLIGAAVVLLASASGAKAQVCGGPACNSTHTGFKMPQAAIDQLNTDLPVARMILENVSNHFKNPIYTNHVSGGTNVINAPRGYRYKGVITASASELVLDIVFVPISPTEAGAAGTTTPPQVDQPAPPPTRIQIDQAGNVALSSLAASIADSVRSYEPRQQK